MVVLTDILAYLEQFAPSRLAEPWDNVGLLVGDRRARVDRAMTCLTITPTTVEEALREGAQLVVSHHPMPFRELKRITDETLPGRLLLRLIGRGVAVVSPHTAFDSAAQGINQALSEGIGLSEIVPLIPHPEGEGTGRRGTLPDALDLAELAQRVMDFLRVGRLHVVGDVRRKTSSVAVGCGAAADLLPAALRAGCQAMVLGEARFHTCLEAEAEGIGLILPGHYATERFGVECLAESLSKAFPTITVWASRDERDPLQWLPND